MTVKEYSVLPVMNPQRIVCAAIRNYTGDVICAPRHYDSVMHSIIRSMPNKDVWYQPRAEIEQGFVDQFGKFLTRKEAYIIARNNGQIIRDCGNENGDELYSEHLY